MILQFQRKPHLMEGLITVSLPFGFVGGVNVGQFNFEAVVFMRGTISGGFLSVLDLYPLQDVANWSFQVMQVPREWMEIYG